MKDLLQEFRKWDTFEDMEKGFCGYLSQLPQLPQRMEVPDQEKLIKAMKTLHAIIKFMFEAIQREYNDADASYSEAMIELIDKHPYVVDLPFFEEVFSYKQKSSFQLYEEAVAENKRRMMFYKVDEQRVRDLQSKLQEAEEKCTPLFGQLKQLGAVRGCVKSSIGSLESDLDRRSKQSSVSAQLEFMRASQASWRNMCMNSW